MAKSKQVELDRNIYAVMNEAGDWYVKGASGRWGTAEWTDDFEEAKIFLNTGPARAVVTQLIGRGVRGVNLVTIPLTVGIATDESARAQESIRKKAEKREEAQRRAAQRQLEAAQRALTDAEQRLQVLRKF